MVRLRGCLSVEMENCDYIAAGFYLARLANRPEYVSAQLLPELLLSASCDICDVFPNTWAIEWTSEDEKERLESAEKFSISSTALSKVTEWATQSFSKEFAWPNVFYSIEGARKAKAMFLSHLDDVALFGLGLHKSNVEQFLSVAKPRPQQPGFAPEGATGVFEIVSIGEILPDGGTSLGYELLVVKYGLLTCSWLCNGLEKTFAKSLGVIPNAHGFISTFEEASRCVTYVSDGHVGAEPGLWLPWLIMKYD